MKKMGRPTKAEMALRAKQKAELEILRRTGGRLKKATKVFDPSENYVRKRRNAASTDKDERIKDGTTNSKISKDTSNPVQEPYLKLQALDELLGLDDQNAESDLNKTEEMLDVLMEEPCEVLETSKKSKESDAEFTPDVKKIQKRRRRRKRTIRNTILQKNDCKDSDPEFIPDGVSKKIKLPKLKLSKSLDGDSKDFIKLEEISPKEMKTVFSDEVVAQKPQRGRPSKRSNTELISVCSICIQAVATELITCLDCNTKAHINCLKTNFINKKLLEFNWHCDNCKICEICYETYEIGNIITCSVCVKSYHSLCHVPAISDDISKFDQANWVCTRCASKITLNSKKKSTSLLSNHEVNQTANLMKMTVLPLHSLIKAKEIELEKPSIPEIDDKMLINKLDNTNSPLTIPSESSTLELQLEKNSLATETETINENINISDDVEVQDIIPDVSTWSCEKLAQFIAEIFPNEAHVFIDNEIDGASLLLMSRSSVLTRLGLKLGPALRLYNFIITLQTRKNDEFSTWFY